MAQRSDSPGPAPDALRLVHDGILAVAEASTVESAVLAALDTITAPAPEATVARGLVLRDLERHDAVGPVGGSTHRRLVLERFLAGDDESPVHRYASAGVQHVERVAVTVDDVEVATLEVYLFEPSVYGPGLDTVLAALAGAVALVARAERAERRAKAQLQMIGNLAHELRTPLTVILGYTDILATSWATLDEKERDHELAVLARQARRMLRLSVEASTISKTGDLGVQDLQLEEVDVAAAVQTAVADLLHDRDVPVRCGAGLHVVADPDRLQQMLLNLLGNAVAHGMPPIEIEARHGPKAAFVHVTVSDAGRGIDPALLPRLFEPFTRGSVERTDQHSGLGLSIVRHLAQRHGGDVFYEPNRPRGTRMTLSLPAA